MHGIRKDEDIVQTKVNCGHYAIPFFPGYSRIRPPAQNEEENAKEYELSQKQRALERKLRNEKRDLAVLKAQGASEEEIAAQRERVRAADAKLDDFSSATGRARRKSREYTPIKPTFPDKDTYDPKLFDSSEKAEINQFYRGGGTSAVPGSPVETSPVPRPRHAEYIPAKTITEAEEKGKRFVGDYMGKVSYKGIDLEYANKCNAVLTDVYETFDVTKMGSIQPMNMRSNIFKGSTSEAAYRWGGVGGDLFINPTYYKSKKALAAHLDEIEQLLGTVKANSQSLIDRGKVTGKQKVYLEALLRTGRQTVSQSVDFVEGNFVHECGHMLDDHGLAKKLREAFKVDGFYYQEVLAKSRDQYGGGISAYATSDNAEYIAESFCAWWYGETDIIDPIIKETLDGMAKQ